MKHIFSLLILIAAIQTASYGQNSKIDSLDRSLIQQLINREFANLINPQSGNVMDNFASIDLTEAEVNFAGSVVFNSSILGIRAKGGITDGFLPIFSNSKLNSKLGLDIQYSFLDFRKNKSILWYDDDYEKYIRRKASIQREYEIKKIEIENESAENEMKLEIIRTKNEIQKQNKAIENIEKKIKTTLNKDSLDLHKLQRDKLQTEVEKQKFELYFKEKQLSEIDPISGKNELIKLKNWREEELRKAKSELKVYGFKIGWFSLSYGILNNSFMLFDPEKSFDDQVSEHNFISHSLKLNYNYYNLTPAAYESYFLSAGIGFSLEDNLSDLTKMEINETENLGTNSTGSRTTTDKYDVFQGSYKKDLLVTSFNADFYYFLFKNNKSAIHIYPEQKIAKGIKPTTNLGLGFLLTFKDQSNINNLVNAEVYVNLLDIANNNDSEDALLYRSSYGLRFTIPINFNSNIK